MPTWQFYVDRQGYWRWRVLALNGRIIAASSEGFTTHWACVYNARLNGYRGR